MSETAPIVTEPTAPVETTPPAAAVTPPEPPKAGVKSAEFSALVRKERALQRQRELIKTQQSQMSEREAKLKAFETASDPISVLQAKGYTYQEATDYILNEGKSTPETELKSIKQQIAEIKAARDQEKLDAENNSKTQAQQTYDNALAEFRTGVDALVASNPVDYELIALNESQDLVVATVTEHWEQEYKKWNENQSGPKPKAMSMKEAADLVEAYHDSLVEKSVGTKKWRSKLAPGEAGKAPAKPAASPTLSHAVTSSSAPSMLPAKNENERMARALAAMTK